MMQAMDHILLRHSGEMSAPRPVVARAESIADLSI